MLNAACTGADELLQAAVEEFRKHPDYAIITTLADLTGARLLAEIGDDHGRFADDRALKAYTGSAPVTEASGKVISITHRRIKNDRLAAVGWVWATYAAINPGSAREHYRDCRLPATGGRLLVASVDSTDHRAVAETVLAASDRWGTVTGLVTSAGCLARGSRWSWLPPESQPIALRRALSAPR